MNTKVADVFSGERTFGDQKSWVKDANTWRARGQGRAVTVTFTQQLAKGKLLLARSLTLFKGPKPMRAMALQMGGGRGGTKAIALACSTPRGTAACDVMVQIGRQPHASYPPQRRHPQGKCRLPVLRPQLQTHVVSACHRRLPPRDQRHA
jgi:hypothetical protein